MHNFKKYLGLILILGITHLHCFAQTQTKPETLTNANIVALFKAGLSKSVVLTTIQNASTNFDTSTNGIIDLKQKGVPDDVIEAMINKTSKVPPVPAGTMMPFGAAQPATAPNQPGPGTLDPNNLAALEPGIYYYDDSTGQLMQMDGSVFSQTKVGSGILTAISYGVAKTKAKAVLSSAQANFRINSKTPAFYFIFPHTQGGNFASQSTSGSWYSDATSPNEFLLVRFKVKEKSREIVTGSYGTYSGFSGGIDDDNKVAFRSEKVIPGIYRVYLEGPLNDREYAFMFAGTAQTAQGGTTSQKAFDFSIAGNSVQNESDPRLAHPPGGPPPPPNPLNLFRKKKTDTTGNSN